ncbi:MAG: GIY-YIG nuclease family protein [bacterium]|nr:GIY-YIG nuclease family protein [bacterium]
MGYSVYALVSLKDGIRYVGSGEDPLERLRRHNKGDYRFTKGHRPWKLVYREDGLKTRALAMRREKYLKSGQGRKELDTLVINYSGIV